MYHGLGGTAADTIAFDDAVSKARSALTDLSRRARALQLAATSQAVQNIADEAHKFATTGTKAGDPAFGRGPRLVTRAQRERDSVRLKAVQRVVKNATQVMSGELSSAIIRRFALMTIPIIGTAAALSPASVQDAVRKDLQDMDLPAPLTGDPKKTELMIKIGLGIAALFTVGYVVRAFK